MDTSKRPVLAGRELEQLKLHTSFRLARDTKHNKKKSQETVGPLWGEESAVLTGDEERAELLNPHFFSCKGDGAQSGKKGNTR